MGITDVYVFGHSFDITDEDILREFFTESCFRVHIYYKDKQKQAVLIANLEEMVVGNHGKQSIKYHNKTGRAIGI